MVLAQARSIASAQQQKSWIYAGRALMAIPLFQPVGGKRTLTLHLSFPMAARNVRAQGCFGCASVEYHGSLEAAAVHKWEFAVELTEGYMQ